MHQKLRHQLNIHMISGNLCNGTTKLCVLYLIPLFFIITFFKK
jgi:hypothetical protein